ncbi:MAG TPA: hypothetical protein VF759_00655 [Allosphingosinicella sp.]|jgi:hypothetical protein
MLATIVVAGLLAGSEGLPAVNLGPNPSDPNRMICKYDLQPGSRLAKRKVCLTSSQWAEWKQIERLNLLRYQFNGASGSQ